MEFLIRGVSIWVYIFTDVFIVYPLIFHSIQDEIPEVSRPLMTRLYQLWLVLLGTLIINFVACIFVLTSGSNDGGKDLGSSIGYVSLPWTTFWHGLTIHRYLFVIGILSFLLWYRCVQYRLCIWNSALMSIVRPIYNGYMKVGLPPSRRSVLI